MVGCLDIWDVKTRAPRAAGQADGSVWRHHSAFARADRGRSKDAADQRVRGLPLSCHGQVWRGTKSECGHESARYPSPHSALPQLPKTGGQSEMHL